MEDDIPVSREEQPAAGAPYPEVGKNVVVKYMLIQSEADKNSTNGCLLKNECSIMTHLRSGDCRIPRAYYLGDGRLVTKTMLSDCERSQTSFFKLPPEARKYCTRNMTAFCLSMQYVPAYNLLELLSAGVSLEAGLARELFCNLVGRVAEIHNRSVAHLDLKLENVLACTDGSLCVIDFGISNFGWESNVKGCTNMYCPLEAYMRNVSSCYVCDIFSLGVILFMLRFSRNPFKTSNVCCASGMEQRGSVDQEYTSIYYKDYTAFWAYHANALALKMSEYVDPQFMDLLNSMLASEPELRPSLDEIMMHPWVVGRHELGVDLATEIYNRSVKYFNWRAARPQK